MPLSSTWLKAGAQQTPVRRRFPVWWSTEEGRKEALDGGCALERARSAPCLRLTLRNFPQLSGRPRGPPQPPASPRDGLGSIGTPLRGKSSFLGLSFRALLERSSGTGSPGRCFFQLRSHGAPPFLCALLMRFFPSRTRLRINCCFIFFGPVHRSEDCFIYFSGFFLFFTEIFVFYF